MNAFVYIQNTYIHTHIYFTRRLINLIFFQCVCMGAYYFVCGCVCACLCVPSTEFAIL